MIIIIMIFCDDSDDNDDDDNFVGESQPAHSPPVLHLSTGECATIILNSIIPKIHDYPLPMIMIRWMFTIFCECSQFFRGCSQYFVDVQIFLWMFTITCYLLYMISGGCSQTASLTLPPGWLANKVPHLTIILMIRMIFKIMNILRIMMMTLIIRSVSPPAKLVASPDRTSTIGNLSRCHQEEDFVVVVVVVVVVVQWW